MTNDGVPIHKPGIMQKRLFNSARDILVVLALFAAFFLLYRHFALNLILAKARPFEKNDLLFQLDALRSILYLTTRSADFYRTSVHPLYAIWMNPIGILLKRVLHEPSTVAITINAFLGALNVAAAYLFFRRMGGKILNALLVALVFGLSTSQLVLSAVPDTAALAVLSLLLTYLLFWISCNAECSPESLPRKGILDRVTHAKIFTAGGYFLPWVIVGLFAFGVTITNFVQAVICYSIALLAKKGWKQAAKWAVVYPVLVLICAAALAGLQKMIYPTSALFFIPSNLQEEQNYSSLLLLSQPLTVLAQVFKHFLMVNVIAADPAVIRVGSLFPAVSFAPSQNFSAFGIAALALWFGALLYNLREKPYRRSGTFYAGLLLCLVFNLIMHSFYGIGEKGNIELFPYTGNFTLIVVILVLSWFLFTTNQAAILGACLGVCLLFANNALVMNKILDIFNDARYTQTSSQKVLDLVRVLYDYRQEKNDFGAQFEGLHELPPAEFFTFGMGSRPKYIYKGGRLLEALTGKTLYQWPIRYDLIVPPAYTVILTTLDSRNIFISEDYRGIYIDENDRRTAVFQGSEIRLPDFKETRYPNILKVLHQEILFNIKNGQPLPNIFVYDKPWYRDAAMIGAVLAQTHNTGLIKDWVMGLTSIYDGNNRINEPDNLGEALYMISLVSDRSHPLVPAILAELNRIKNQDGFIEGYTDSALHPVYQTKWAKFGLQALGLADPFRVPAVSESYDTLFWLDGGKGQTQELPDFSSDYPYLAFASSHFTGSRYGALAANDYPLTWEANASAANYAGMEVVDGAYVANRISAPHTWHAAEAFLYLITLKK